jgi:hypothetical protein
MHLYPTQNSFPYEFHTYLANYESVGLSTQTSVDSSIEALHSTLKFLTANVVQIPILSLSPTKTAALDAHFRYA